MKSRSHGQIIFGAAAILFGVIALLWHDAETWQTLRQLWRLPFGTTIGEGLMIVQIAGGLGILYPKTTRFASIALGVVYLVFCLACIPVILRAPTVYAIYGSFFEQFCCFSGVIALYATETRTRALGRWARLGIGVSAISFTLSQVIYLSVTADMVPKWIPPNQKFWAVVTTIAFGLAAIAILLNRLARLSMRLLALMLGLFGLLVWVPRLMAQPKSHENWSEFALTFLITGAVWMAADSK